MLGTTSYQLDQDIEAETLWHRHCSICIMFWWLLAMPQLPISITALREVLSITILHCFMFSHTWRFLSRILQNASRIRFASLPRSAGIPSTLNRLLKVGLIVIRRWLIPFITKSWFSLIIRTWWNVICFFCHTDAFVSIILKSYEENELWLWRE